MKAVNASILLMVVAILSGCTIVDGGSIVTGKTRNPVPVESVRVYRVAPEKFEEIAIVSASAGHDFKSNSALMESTIQKLKEEAAELGANGVLLSEIDERDAPKTTTTFGSASAHASDGSSAHAHGNSVSVDRGDSYTRVRGIAIYVSGG